ncbi:MAG: UvrD-helicase domain-containing protein [Phycisphaeraceae bacterium]|nr:UvrD-helicase domain-containing protein [Phycisphaeraceae bacterium]MCW5754356.1 UvrD-helicase domain-containing protein [Phycisphaeraceae bacterium]
MPLEPDALLDGLTPPQREAVLHVDGPLLILAAAGSGKTRVITRRVARLLSLGIPPWSILALTFTNKAAGEMRERIAHLLEHDPRLTRGLTVTTFHSLCARLLRRYAPEAGLQPDYTIYDTADQVSLLKKVLADLDLSSSNWPARSVLSTISNAKNDLLDAQGFAARSGDFYSKQIARIYESYERALRSANAVDFDDLLMCTARMLRTEERVRTEVRHRWRYLLIDEYQDTNRAQFEIARLIAGDCTNDPDAEKPNICVVGDPDQSIYGWRGADISNILQFEELFAGCRVIALGENFRSTGPILACADALIRHNKMRKHKPLFTSTPGGEPVEAILTHDEQHEARLVADWLRRHREDDRAWRDMAVFYRTNSLSRVMEDALRSAGIPYVIARGTAFYDREEVRNALAYLRVVANPADEVSLLRIINMPARGIGKSTLDAVSQWAAASGCTLFEALRRAREIGGLSPRAQQALAGFVSLIDGLSGSGTFMGEAVSSMLSELVERVIRESGLERHYRAQADAGKSESDAERLDNLAELVSSAAQFEREYDPGSDPAAFPGPDVLGEAGSADPPALLAMLRGYLESVALVADADAVDPAQGAVTLMTLHAAKGLEFSCVAMIGLEEGLLPHSRALENPDDMEEERRLCFVGITRARTRLVLTSARMRTQRGFAERTIPSRFLNELPREHCVFSDQTTPAFEEAPEVSARATHTTRATPFPPGSIVRHPQFGLGRVLAVSPGASARARIEFHEAGVKTLVLEYARLTRVK